MNVVIIGDIGWRDLYHLGDEAMTEAAIDMLRERGITDITLVAAEPEVSADFYGLPAVSRVGFKGRWTRNGMNGHLSRVADTLDADIEPGTIFAAIRDCDAVLIAGGGNMNSQYYHQLYERVATKRIAQHFGKPLYVTSQTVGPILEPHDRDLVVEIADYARVFGAREPVTAALLREHVADPERIHHTLDDAAVLTGDDDAYAAVGELSQGKPYVVASFTNHPGSTWGDEDQYYRDVAALCRDISATHDVDVLLAPHAGSLEEGSITYDQESNEVIASLAGTDRVRSTRMITAREDVALIDRAALSLSTRYHPSVFAPAVATPLVAIAPSYYSSVRMRGSLGNVGLQAFALPTSSLHVVRDAIAEAIAPSEKLSTFMSSAKEQALAFQNSWWDALVSSMKADAAVAFSSTLTPDTYTPQGDWSRENENIVPVFNDYAQTVDALNRHIEVATEHQEQLEKLEVALADARSRLDKTRARLHQYQSRKVVRLIDRIGRRLKGRR